MSDTSHHSSQSDSQEATLSDSAPKLTRQEIYDRIRETSKDEYILQEMIRLGFWDKDEEQPNLTQEFIERRAELMRKMRELSQLDSLYSDPEKALEALHKERKKAALEKREQTRQARNQERYERALAWYHKQKESFTWLGDDVSLGLANKESDAGKLESQDLPHFENIASLAQAMGISVSELRFLAYQKDVSNVSHYQRFTIAKKSGGERHISAPMPRLKRAQYWLLDNVLEKLTVHQAAHGFVSGKSIVTNAQPHVGKAVVINMDLKDFFPSISYKRVKGLFRAQGYSEELATVFGLLTTEPEVQELEMDGKTWFVAQGERRLPQGSPCSPAITNALCRRLDARLQGMADKLGFTYSRYADDLTFSTNDPDKVQSLLWRAKQIVADEGFTLHPEKTRVMRRHQKQEVTGVVVNDKLSVDRKTLKRFRAVLKQIELDGPEGKTWGAGDLFRSLEGYANFVAMVDPEKGIPLQKSLVHLKRQYGIQTKHGKVTALNKRLLRAKAAKGEIPRENWWQPEEKPEPELELTPNQKAEQKRAEQSARRAEQRANTESQNVESEQGDGWDELDSDANKVWTTREYVLVTLMLPLVLIHLFFRAPWNVKCIVVGVLWLLYLYLT
ncbi:Reverse transcriptase RT-Ne144 [Vibrio nigripulchritudo MADA3029]|uniref:reverse transcriptase family protein n=1 Tax=Vibrio nigripulchritudo TaxID=28173 RepID=UPI0003B21B09|nr:reverse transcriptase family protein [Vibrio nigripulchritudo]CCN50236.1 Reverse transcriptase RT-Ne144 [Vibrio nigripulchritudo MADA3020]CCN53338.1 Reverse transcriptase RT-Ne144 [Vibrio nigripulchritudo MADA3021]CCN60174.1 Reverse transcriptase RT-Ne144 [Vibrio nigripulchritudo MADA3029]